MTTVEQTNLDESATARELLFGGELKEPTEVIAESLRDHDVVKPQVSGFPALTAAVEHEVASTAHSFLSLDLLDLLVAGWKRYEALAEAARRTRDAPPTTEEVVALVAHRVESSHDLKVELLVDGRSVGTVNMQLSIAFDLVGLLVVVRQGRLVAVRSGKCTVIGTMTIEQAVVAERKRALDVPGALRLQGIALVESAACTPEASPADWYPDPTRRYELRRWDGCHWTEHVASQGRVISDPVESKSAAHTG
ncbi:DUF2510 domain-containing protein [Mycobacterium sp. 3519A]|uniref:DUF2510 domain-containing protein n=1 Tax=Mycobacterium sp. 3519A TaxID=2057184 RepID=UPI001359586A|nr:DUF2510 domain-containing protein [Mycobacterium sp. 3519A]